MRAIWGAGEDDDTDNESDGMVIVRTMTIMRIGASWGSEEGEWGERSKRQKQLMLEAMTGQPTLNLYEFSLGRGRVGHVVMYIRVTYMHTR